MVGFLTHLMFFLFVPMFSGWHKSKEANYGTRLWPFFHTYATGYGSHAPPFVLPFMLILIGFAQKSELWQQVMSIPPPPGYGRHAPRLFGPFIFWFLRQIMAILCPPNSSGPGISQPILMLKYLARFPMPSGHLTWAVTYLTPKVEVAYSPYGTFRLFMPPLCPK